MPKDVLSPGTGTATINVIPPVSLVMQPVSQTVCIGTNVIFSILASGSNLQYQWQKNGVDIAGAISRFLVFNNCNRRGCRHLPLCCNRQLRTVN